MTTITETATLRSAFLKIGWAPIITICGVILVAIIGAFTGIGTINTIDDSFGLVKGIMIGAAVMSLVGYILSYLGFVQASKAFGITKAGDAFSTLRLIFLIYSIIGAIFLLITIFLPASPHVYSEFAATHQADIRKWATVGLIFVVSYLAIAVFSIIALFVIKSKTSEIAAATNIQSMGNVAKGATWGVYCFFAGIAVGIIDAAVTDPAVTAVCELALLAVCIYALVKWIGGWLGAATEVLRHPVEAGDYNNVTPS